MDLVVSALDLCRHKAESDSFPRCAAELLEDNPGARGSGIQLNKLPKCPVGPEGFEGVFVKFDTFMILDAIANLTSFKQCAGCSPP